MSKAADAVGRAMRKIIEYKSLGLKGQVPDHLMGWAVAMMCTVVHVHEFQDEEVDQFAAYVEWSIGKMEDTLLAEKLIQEERDAREQKAKGVGGDPSGPQGPGSGES